MMPGAPVAEAVLADVTKRVAALAASGVVPGLGTILVGDDGPSAGYVARKHETCEQVGIKSFNIEIPAEAGQAALLEAVDSFNSNPLVDGYLIQHPVPDGFDFNAALSKMDPAKDADGLHPTNLGRLVLQEPGPVPCTPAGIQAMLEHYGVETRGKNAVVVGRGPTLGRPMALLLSNRGAGADAAVTVVHSRVENLADYPVRTTSLIGSGVVNQLSSARHGSKPGAWFNQAADHMEKARSYFPIVAVVASGRPWITPSWVQGQDRHGGDVAAKIRSDAAETQR
ncbi:UNVERIFIED_CONTAM: hypothetical protein GTU68_009403 [Idotea baltica]|nr:hypothetical protein [Idotea baltica]